MNEVPTNRRRGIADLVVWTAVVLQIASALAMAIPTFGFDHRSDWGLDFNHLMLLWLIYGASFVVGVSVAFATHRDRLVSLQFWLVPILGAVIFVAKAIRANI